MKTYIYKATEGGARGYNRTITVYRVKNNKPEFLGYNDKIDTASTYGDKGEAVSLIGELCGHKNDHYSFDSENIQLFEV
jgi:hypothetical protein